MNNDNRTNEILERLKRVLNSDTCDANGLEHTLQFLDQNLVEGVESLDTDQAISCSEHLIMIAFAAIREELCKIKSSRNGNCAPNPSKGIKPEDK